MQAGHVRLVGIGELRHSGRVGVGKLDAKGLDQLARRDRAKACDHAVAADMLGPAGGLGGEARRAAAGLDHFHAARRRAVAAFELAVLDRGEDQRQVAVLAAREFLVAVDHDHAVLLCQRDGVFDRRIAGADNDDGFVLVGLRIVELVLHDGKILARRPELAQVALQADREHDRFRRNTLAVGGLDLNAALLTLDRLYAGAKAEVDAVLAEFRDPTSRVFPRAAPP